MDITKHEVEQDNLVVKIKGTKPDEVIGCQYIVYVKKRVFDNDLMGNLREYNVFKTYPDFKRLVRDLSEAADGGAGRAKLPLLGPNPYSIDFMDGDAASQKIRLEFTLKRLTDVIMIITKHPVLKLHPMWLRFLQPPITTSRKPI